MRSLLALQEAGQLVHGIFIELHPVWRALYEHEWYGRAGLPARRAIAVTGPYWPWLSDEREVYDPRFIGDYGRFFFDTEHKPEGWNHFLDHFKKEKPFLVKIYIDEITHDQLPLRRRIEELVSRQPFFCLVVEGSPATFSQSARGAADIHVTHAGTLGGYLIDANGKTYGTTCAHVAQSTANQSSVTLHDIRGRSISSAGTVSYTNYADFIPLAAGSTCNPYINSPSLDCDVALLDLNSRISTSNVISGLGQVSGYLDRSTRNTGDTVHFAGARTPANTYEIGGYGVMCKIVDTSPRPSSGTSQQSTAAYCFSGVFDFYTPTRNRLQRAVASLPILGDSGGWIVYKQGSISRWFGMLMAVQGARGISAFASSIVDYCDNKWQLKLAVL